MSWKKILKEKFEDKLNNIKFDDKRFDPRKEMNAHLVLDSFLPTSGWYRHGESIPVEFTIKNTGNFPSSNTIVAIYAGKSGKKLSEFELISSFKDTLYPGEKKTIQGASIEQEKLPMSRPILLPLPGSSRIVLIAVCFDLFLTPVGTSLNINKDAILGNDFLKGGYYLNSAIRQGTTERIFGYNEIK